jgi:hypothetical protein
MKTMVCISTHVQHIQFEVMWLIKRKKNSLYQNQGWEPIHQKYKANESTSRHTPKKKQKQAIIKNKVKTYANRTHGYEMTINDNKEDLR